MSLYEQWQEMCEQKRTPEEQNIFWAAYFDLEKEAYRKILIEENNVVEGTVAELAEKFDMTKAQVVGFARVFDT